MAIKQLLPVVAVLDRALGENYVGLPADQHF